MDRAEMDETESTLCLDFVNTLEWRLSDRNEYLKDYRDVVGWARQERLVTEEEGRYLLDEADRRLEEAAAAYEEAIALREAVYAVFSAAARGVAPPAFHLNLLNAAISGAMVPARLVPAKEGFEQQWLDPKNDLGWMLNPIARSAMQLLTSPEVDRLKECPGAPGKACGFLFLDTTKNRSRRWCSGRTCGNRARLHRHYARIQDTGSRESVWPG